MLTLNYHIYAVKMWHTSSNKHFATVRKIINLIKVSFILEWWYHCHFHSYNRIQTLEVKFSLYYQWVVTGWPSFCNQTAEYGQYLDHSNAILRISHPLIWHSSINNSKFHIFTLATLPYSFLRYLLQPKLVTTNIQFTEFSIYCSK
jgi:hypothetical protein